MAEEKKIIESTEELAAEKEGKKESSGAVSAGLVYGDVSNASTLYGMDKFGTPKGHGFAAERANHLYDKISGKDAKIVGDDNVKNGADRIVDGIEIQSKYCKTGSKCISECFEDGKLKYINKNGEPMQIEVPSDKYEDAVKAMADRIKRGEVPGISDPEEAKNIVRKGHFTYEQAKNIAKAGTVESIAFDSVNGAVIATYSFGISTALSFATSIWNGEDMDIALKTATYTGLKVGGTTFITAVLASQLSKAGLNSMLVGSSEAIVGIMGPKVSAMLVNAFRSGTNIYGAAAMKSAAKMLRGNVITGAITTVVLSTGDIVNIFRGRISGRQLFKNVAGTTATVAGGTAGWVAGAAAGAAVGSAIPIVGTAIGAAVGGIAGSFAGGAASGKATSAVLGAFIEDDADEMVRIIEKAFGKMAEDYLLNQKEAEHIIDNLKDILDGKLLKDMYESSDREKFAKKLLEKPVKNEVKKRQRISMPSMEDMEVSLKEVLEEIADNMEQHNITEDRERKNMSEEMYLNKNACNPSENCMEIGQACADRVNARIFTELDEYLVYLDDKKEIIYYKVHKQTGKRSILWKSGKTCGYDTFCGAGNKIYIFSLEGTKEILEINADTGEEKTIEFIYKESDSYYSWENDISDVNPQCNREHLIYKTKIKGNDTVVHVHLSDNTSVIITDDSKIPFYREKFFLKGDAVYFLPESWSELYISFESDEKADMIYQYDLQSHELLETGKLSRPDKRRITYWLCENLLFGASLEKDELFVCCLDLNNIKSVKQWTESLSEYDIFDFEWWQSGKYVFMVERNDNGGILAYDILEKKLAVIVEESEGVHSYIDGILMFKELKYSVDIKHMALIGDTLYYTTDDAVYKTPVDEENQNPESL